MKYLSLVLLLFIFSACQTKKQDLKKETISIDKKTIKDEEIVPESKHPSIITVEEKNNIATPKPILTKTSLKEKSITTAKTQINKEVNTLTTILESEKEVFGHSIWHNLLQKHVSDHGNVNYKGFKKDHATLAKYIKYLSNNIPDVNSSKPTKLAYWINVYNALTIDLILKNYPIKSIKDIKNPWDQELWVLGGKKYDLNEVEHGILRKMNEPRIHFAIVCASFSCPKLENKAFSATNLEFQLTKATKGFLADSSRNNLSKDSIKISKIFDWFAEDFTTKGSLIDFINTYATIVVDKNARKSFKVYNWSLNE